jgi:mannitol/fructose-specific phosphotransferase system IIA component (Ntr-type)
MAGTQRENGTKIPSGAVTLPRASDLLVPERVRIPLRGLSKEDVLSDLVDVVAQSLGMDAQREEILQAVLEREEVLSTGIGDGIALPHAKYNGLSELVMAAGSTLEPVNYGALDGEPVRLVFLLLGPDSAAGAHVRALSRLSRLMREVSLRQRLAAAANAEEFLDLLVAAEGAG